jgi:cytochrome c oxidase assembly factor CtaG
MAYALYWSPFAPFGHAVPALRTDAARTVYLATGSAQCGLLGALLAFSPRAVYPYYVTTLASGNVALDDQQLAGMIMLLSGAAVFAVAAVLVVRGE